MNRTQAPRSPMHNQSSVTPARSPTAVRTSRTKNMSREIEIEWLSEGKPRHWKFMKAR